MATSKLTEDEGIFYALRERYGSVDAALASNPNIWGDSSASGITDEASLRSAVEGPDREGIIAILIGLNHDRTAAPGPVDRDETLSIHAEKNQDIEVENDETHFAPRHAGHSVWDDTDIVHVLDDDGPSTLMGVHNDGEIYSALGGHHILADIPGHVGGITGDWNSDGKDTVGFESEAGDVDGTDFL